MITVRVKLRPAVAAAKTDRAGDADDSEPIETFSPVSGRLTNGIALSPNLPPEPKHGALFRSSRCSGPGLTDPCHMQRARRHWGCDQFGAFTAKPPITEDVA